MEYRVSVSKASVMEEVYQITGYTGVKNSDMDKLTSTEDDSSLLLSFYREATSSLSDEVSRVGYLLEESDSTSTFLYNLPSNWNTGMERSLAKAMAQYVMNYVCAKWFSLTKKDETQQYQGVCQQLAVSILKYLYERKKPR